MSGGPAGLTHELLRDIDETAREVFDLATISDAERKGGSRRTSYEKTLGEVETIAGKTAARALAEWIMQEIEEEERFPDARDVRQRGAKLCRENGHEVSTNDWLGA